MPSNQSPLGALPARFRRERLLIVGYGDVGQRVARLLGTATGAQRRVRIMVLNREIARTQALRVQSVQPLLGDLDQAGSLKRLAGIASRVLHLAPPAVLAQIDGPNDPRTIALMRALRLRKLPRSLVYASTTGVYGDCRGEWVTEARAVAPATARGQRRVGAEHAIRFAGRSGLHASILRIPGIYAPDREGGTPRARLLRGTPVLQASDDVYTNHIHADDLARACLKALWQGKPQRVYHASDDSVLKMGDYFDLAADLYGMPRPQRISRAQAESELPATLLSFMSESRRLNNRRLKQELRLQLRYPTVAEGLRE